MGTRNAAAPHPSAEAENALDCERLCQVVLFNDDVNTCEHVVTCLMRIFKHPAALAVKIMLEAHLKGRAIAEVEARTPALQHAAALHREGLGARVEEI